MKKKLAVCLALLTALQNMAQPHLQDLAFAGVSKPETAVSVNHTEIFSGAEIKKLMELKKPGSVILGYSHQRRPVFAHYFPGTSDKKALIIGGMHGSELSSIELAYEVVEMLREKEGLYYNVVVIPKLFPDNAEKALSNHNGRANKGRYTHDKSVDPNRQMPALGKAFDPDRPLDYYGRKIERENQMLLQLIQEFQPSRIVNLHAIRDTSKGGIYADPRTDCNDMALGFEKDSSLAVGMAWYIHRQGGKVPGNRIGLTPNALYYNDPSAVRSGSYQARNLHGSPLPGKRGSGVSLGSWATTAVCDEPYSREAIQLITVEFPGYKNSTAYLSKEEREQVAFHIGLYAGAIVHVCLSDSVE